jgi:hypothetical protein
MRPVPDYLEELRDQVPRLGSERDALGVKTRIQPADAAQQSAAARPAGRLETGGVISTFGFFEERA